MARTRRTRKLTLRRRGKTRSRILLPARGGHVQEILLAKDVLVRRRRSQSLRSSFPLGRVLEGKVLQRRRLPSKALPSKAPKRRRKFIREQFKA